MPGDEVEVAVACVGGELLGIVELEEILGDAARGPVLRQDHGSHEDGAGEWPAAGLIDTGHGVGSDVPELAFVVETVCRGW